MESVLLATSIAAVTEFLKRVKASDWEGAAVIVVAAVIGGLAGWNHLQGLTVQAGIIAGLGIAGIHGIAKQIG